MVKAIVAGLASFGMSGRVFHAPLIVHNKRFRLKRIIERSKNEACVIYPGILSSRSLDDLIEDNDIELIVVNTPDRTHYEITKKCIEAGKHVIVEKPFTQTTEQGRELIDLANKKGIILSVFQNRRWDGDFLTVKKIISDGLLGHLIDYESHFDRYRPNIQRDTWKEQSSSGTGTLFNLGSHMIDQALVLFGMPDAVTADLKIVRAGGEVDDWYDIRLHYPDVNVNLKASLLVKESGPRYVLHGTKGSFLKYGTDPQEDAFKKGKSLADPDWGREPESLWGIINTDEISGRKRIETLPGNYNTYYDALYESIVNGKELPVKPEDALEVIRIIEASMESNRIKRTIDLHEG